MRRNHSWKVTRIPAEVRQRFEVCRPQIAQLRSELQESLAKDGTGYDSVGLYGEFVKEIACMVSKANVAETFADSVLAPRADEHTKFLAIWLPILAVRETFAAIQAFGPQKLKRFLSRPDNERKLHVRLDAAVRTTLQNSGAKGAASVQGTADAETVRDTATRRAVATESAQSQVTTVLNSQSALAARRQGVVMPILIKKRWSRGKWATKAAVGKNCVYEYLNGMRNPGYENRKAMADALEMKTEDLPD